MSQPRPYVTIAPGDPAPWFHGRTMSNPNYAFDTAAGRYIVMCFFLSAGDPMVGELKTASTFILLVSDHSAILLLGIGMVNVLVIGVIALP